MRLGSRSRPPAPATRPRLTSGKPNFAASLATIRSHARTNSNPPASAYPSTAAMIGFAGGCWTKPPKPRSATIGESPDRKPLRSMPALNVPPAPVSTSTRTSGLASKSSTAAAMPRATSPLTAFLASGLLIVMTATPSPTSVRTASGIGASLLAVIAISGSRRLLGLEPDAAVEADDLGVHIVVLDQRADKVRELSSCAHSLGENDRSGQLGLELIAGGPAPVNRGVDDPRADRVHADPDRRKIARRRNGHADDAALGGRVGQLPSLALETCNRGCVDDHAPLTVSVSRLCLGHCGCANAHQVERADQVHLDDFAERCAIVRRAIAADGPLRPADASAVDDAAQRRA